MSIVLSHGYFIQEDEKEQEIMRPYPPLGLLYISAYLKQSGFKTKVFDSTFETKKNQRAFLQADPPEILALYVNMMTKVNVLELMKWMRSVDELAATKIILGGPDVTYNIEDYLREGADFVVFGEGEESCRELVQAISLRNPWMEDIAGIAYINGLGEVQKNKPREKIRDIDVLPLPDREAINLHQYMDVWKSKHGQNAISVSTQRGCPYTCKWCSTAVYGQSYRRRSPHMVARELKYLKEDYRPDTIWFVDDVFSVSHQWLAEFRDEVIEQDAIIPFECITRADRLNEEVLDMLKAAGCFRVWIGAESGSQRIIDAMDRRVKVENVRDMIVQARKRGLEAGTFIMLGYPGETQKDIEETVHHLKTAAPDHFTITIAYPIKGTGLFEEVEAKQTTNLNWAESTDRDRDFERSYPRDYYPWAVRWVVNEVNLSKQKSVGSQFNLRKLRMSLVSRFSKWKMDQISKKVGESV